ncbi:putative membrane-anchored protein [Rhodobium orientis]|uniref:Egg lysin n=1 Tax=Rhodobium orientis TaxID=34017 RepID=A0A327JR00_9HYPH|nr:DUF3422 domain-containing protein [Rhodobium orientis]MBB4304149.1 putative membrane-anchored protein [Rhodobium orientis]MBK5950620.1 hypothetical protein [Rhodobium orientis]RAI28006.1 hypothetical protein CH339_07830 [Rhodobium orientis]
MSDETTPENGGTAEPVTIGYRRFEAHQDRQSVLDEIHARPFPLIRPPLRVVSLSFMNTTMTPDECTAMAADLYVRHGGKPPDPGARYHRAKIDGGVLRWECHNEFVSFVWRCPPEEDPLVGPVPMGPFGEGFTPPGPLVGGGRFALIEVLGDIEPTLEPFDRRSLCVSEVEEGAAIIATDFRQDDNGLTRYAIISRGISEARAGAVFQRLQEVETYRSMTLLGLPAARKATPTVDRIEQELADLSHEARQSGELASNRALLSRLTELASELEADVSRFSYRMSATQAYDEVLQIRLDALNEKAWPGYGTLKTFLARRMNPALRTCQSLEKRQNQLATKLARAIDVLRARVAIDVEHQNVALLNSMNRRAKLQLRLQQTVEGLSIGAISYYLLGIIGYAAKGLKEAHVLPVRPEIVVGIAVPLVVGFVYWMTRRVRRRHAEKDKDND